jgi:hypothetical protein
MHELAILNTVELDVSVNSACNHEVSIPREGKGVHRLGEPSNSIYAFSCTTI